MYKEGEEMRLTAQEIYDRLLNEDHILELEGQIKFFLGGHF